LENQLIPDFLRFHIGSNSHQINPKLRLRLLLSFLFISINCSTLHAQIGFPYCETFTTETTQSTTIFGGDARLAGGVLRLTSNQTSQKGYVYLNIPFSSIFGLKASFEYFSFGGDGADGLTLFLFDADTPVFNPGGFGGSLGYAPYNSEQGLSNAYLGIGFDEYGGFGNSSEGRSGGFAGAGQSRVPNAVVIRGPGKGMNGYPFVVGRKTMATGNDGLRLEDQFPISSGGLGTARVTDPNLPGYRKVYLDLQPNTTGVGFFIKLQMEVTTKQNEPRLVTIFDRPYNFPAPPNLKIGFAASTGGQTNFHEIRNLKVEVSNNDALINPKGVDFEDKASCEGQENTYSITDEEVELPNQNSEIRCLQFYQSLADIEAETGDVCLQGKCRVENRELVVPQGVFKAASDGGDFTFFPNPGTRGQKVTVYYTITDTYGKSSTGNSMTLLIQESPDPVSLIAQNQPNQTTIRLCAGEGVDLEAKGSEIYERFEWYRDGELLAGANSAEYKANMGGDYEVKVYNRKNCPAISNRIKVEYPIHPILKIQNPVVGCEPGQIVDVSKSIVDYNVNQYDYQLSLGTKTWLNGEMEKISQTGIYELRVKEKDLECYSDPSLVEVLIRDEALTADFDFVVKGTNIKGDTEGGIFPDDILQFTAVSDDEIASWKWSFGDGTTDDTQNPTHIYGKKGSFEVELLARNKLGCEVKVKKTISITRSFRLMIPNAFTPTLAENTTFLPKQKGLTQWEIMIFNTWGNLIFQTTELDTSGWDGKIEDRLQDAGVYIYRVNGQATDGEKVSKTGKLNLIR
jgi:hypothetical protein